MVKTVFHRFVVLMCLLCTGFAAAQAEPWTVGQQPIVYASGASGTFNGIVGDGSTPNGGIPPATAYEPADIASNFTESAWLDPTTNLAVNYTVAGPTDQAKIRIKCTPSHLAQVDPIVAPGVAIFGHLHQFFGNTLTNQNSTYASLRTTGGGTCGGGPLNRTAYWISAMMTHLANGLTASVKFDELSGYYTIDGSLNAAKYQRLFRDFSYIGGVDPSNFNATCSNFSGTGWTGYGSCGPTIPPGYVYQGNGFVGWECLNGNVIVNTANGQGRAPYFVGPGGADPWGGACIAGYRLAVVLDAPGCWDMTNLHSPNGRDHVKATLRHNNSGATDACPDHWGHLPPFEGTFFWSLKTNAEYLNWWLASDRMNPPGTAADPSSIDPCRQISANFCGGATAHFDWKGAWSYGTATSPGIMLRWMSKCLGIPITLADGTLTPQTHTCETYVVDDVSSTKSGASPDPTLSNNPIINLTPLYNGPSAKRYFPIPKGTSLPSMQMHLKHAMNDNMPMPANDVQLAGAAPLDFDLRQLGR